MLDNAKRVVRLRGQYTDENLGESRLLWGGALFHTRRRCALNLRM
jgi:hypothetical protein